MTTSNMKEAFVWVWLEGHAQPIVAGKLESEENRYAFYYGRSYLENSNAISFSKKELPLMPSKRFLAKHDMHHVFRDALPDAWGQRLLHHFYQTPNLSHLDMLLLSSSDRIGALHFQSNPDQYEPRYENHATLEQLQQAVHLVETGQTIPTELIAALNHGTSIGGARPKALIAEAHKKYIAKFSSSTDIFPIVQAEYAAMWLAQKVGIHVAPVKLVTVKNKYILLVERFDRVKANDHWARKFMVSGLTLLGLEDYEGRYAGYPELADEIRHSNKDPKKDLYELFNRLVFNILIGNTDDHAKNHAFFWDGKFYQLTPAYDICPYYRVGQVATQAMGVGQYGNASQLRNALSSAARFMLGESTAQNMIDSLVDQVRQYWPEACDHASLTTFQKDQLTGTAVLNPFCFQ